MMDLKALDRACIIFLCGAFFVWSMGGAISLSTLAGGAVAAAIIGAVMHWQDKRN